MRAARAKSARLLGRGIGDDELAEDDVEAEALGHHEQPILRRQLGERRPLEWQQRRAPAVGRTLHPAARARAEVSAISRGAAARGGGGYD